MKFKIKNILLSFILISGLVIFSACPNPQKYSEIPAIEFKQVILFDTIDDITLQNPVKAYKLRFGLIDGDGDIGLHETDTIGYDTDTAYVNNFLSIFSEIKNGDTIVVDSLYRYSYRIPYIQPQGQNKTLIADIYIDFTFAYDRYNNLKYDSVMFEFFVIDTALNKSNIVKTPVLFLDTIGKFPIIEEK